jgi:alkyl hydroperoxide reductase subunit AhpC
MKIALMADLNKTVAKVYSSRYNYKDYGVLYEAEGLALRGTFIIDPAGILRHSSINDTGVGRNIDETLRLVEAFQFNDENGEVCPANWKKGKATMKGDSELSKEYFAKTY